MSLSFPIGKTMSQGTSGSLRTTSEMCGISSGLGMEVFWKGCMPTCEMGGLEDNFQSSSVLARRGPLVPQGLSWVLGFGDK